MNCPNCHDFLGPHDRFCGECGTNTMSITRPVSPYLNSQPQVHPPVAPPVQGNSTPAIPVWKIDPETVELAPTVKFGRGWIWGLALIGLTLILGQGVLIAWLIRTREPGVATARRDSSTETIVEMEDLLNGPKANGSGISITDIDSLSPPSFKAGRDSFSPESVDNTPVEFTESAPQPGNQENDFDMPDLEQDRFPSETVSDFAKEPPVTEGRSTVVSRPTGRRIAEPNPQNEPSPADLFELRSGGRQEEFRPSAPSPVPPVQVIGEPTSETQPAREVRFQQEQCTTLQHATLPEIKTQVTREKTDFVVVCYWDVQLLENKMVTSQIQQLCNFHPSVFSAIHSGEKYAQGALEKFRPGFNKNFVIEKCPKTPLFEIYDSKGKRVTSFANAGRVLHFLRNNGSTSSKPLRDRSYEEYGKSAE